jgi:hypothetical protein
MPGGLRLARCAMTAVVWPQGYMPLRTPVVSIYGYADGQER